MRHRHQLMRGFAAVTLGASLCGCANDTSTPVAGSETQADAVKVPHPETRAPKSEMEAARLPSDCEVISVSPEGQSAIWRRQTDEAPQFFFVDRRSGQNIGNADMPYTGCTDLAWNPSGTAVAFVRRYSTHLWGSLMYSKNGKGRFEKVEYARPDVVELWKKQPGDYVPLIMGMSDAAVIGWIDDQKARLVEIEEEVGTNQSGTIDDRAVFVSYTATIHGSKASVGNVKLDGPATFGELSEKFHLSSR